MLEIVILMGVGYILRKAGALSDALQSGCSEFLMKIAVPALVLSSAATAQFTPETLRQSAMVLLISALGYAINFALGHVAGRALRLPESERVAVTGALMFRNVVFMGYPVCQAMLGPQSLFYAALCSVLYNALMFSFGVSLYSRGRSKEQGKVLRNPALICSLIMIAMLTFGIRFPSVVAKSVSRLADVCTPISLVIIGMILADGDLGAVLRKRTPWVASGLALLVYPLITLIMVLAIKPGTMAASVMLTLSVLPAGTMNVIIAKQYGNAGEESSHVVLHTMLASLAVIPLVLPLLLGMI